MQVFILWARLMRDVVTGCRRWGALSRAHGTLCLYQHGALEWLSRALLARRPKGLGFRPIDSGVAQRGASWLQHSLTLWGLFPTKQRGQMRNQGLCKGRVVRSEVKHDGTSELERRTESLPPELSTGRCWRRGDNLATPQILGSVLGHSF